jgi:hypothetical protein
MSDPQFTAPAKGEYRFTYQTVSLKAEDIVCKCGSDKFESRSGSKYKCVVCHSPCDFSKREKKE